MRIKKDRSVSFSQADIRAIVRVLELCRRLDKEFQPLCPYELQDVAWGAARALTELLQVYAPKVVWMVGVEESDRGG